MIRHLLYLAEEEGFEPPVPLSTAVFKTAAINRSAIPPLGCGFLDLCCKASANIKAFMKKGNPSWYFICVK